MPLTRSVKRARVKNARDQVLGVVLDSKFLHWYESVKVGATCKEMQHIWQERKNRLCEPVLEALVNELNICTNICQTCEKVAFPSSERECQCSEQDQEQDQQQQQQQQQRTPLAHLDPRFDPNYTELSTWEKCRALVIFTATCVSNYQSNFDFDNLTIPPMFRFDWQFPQCRFLAEQKPRRLAFMVKFLAAVNAQCSLYGESRVLAGAHQAAFAGNGLDLSLYRSRFETIISFVLFSVPDWGFRGRILQSHAIPRQQVWEKLGPVLTRKLNFLAPFVSTDEEGTWVAIVPDDMEPVDPQADALALSQFE